jgi:plasmid stability protein
MFMPTLVIRDLSPEIHRLLKERAKEHHRSVNKEVITILEDSVTPSRQTLPPLVKGAFPVTQDWLDEARRTGRE